jgi:hypothetical protein
MVFAAAAEQSATVNVKHMIFRRKIAWRSLPSHSPQEKDNTASGINQDRVKALTAPFRHPAAIKIDPLTHCLQRDQT